MPTDHNQEYLYSNDIDSPIPMSYIITIPLGLIVYGIYNLGYAITCMFENIRSHRKSGLIGKIESKINHLS